MSEVLIVGYGVVGKNTAKQYAKLQPDIYDKYNSVFNTKKENHQYKLAIICVDTPYTENEICDITEVVNAIKENDAENYLIKSTVLPKYAVEIEKIKPKRIFFSPEYFGATVHSLDIDINFTIIGGDKKYVGEVVQVLQKCYTGRHQFALTGIKEACITKYMENSFLATKVSFCNAFYDICEVEHVNYEEVRELFLLDPRVNRSHTYVYDESPYWSSHCLDKDVPAVSDYYKDELLETIVEYNRKRKLNNKYKTLDKQE